MYYTFPRDRPKLIVLSHERSGTHFLMNSLAKCYGYVSAPWVNLDFELGLNFHAPNTLAGYFAQFRGFRLANLVKSHHPISFFDGVLDAILDDFHVFYICRDPRDVMVSYWRYLCKLPWFEGPKPATCSEFIRTEPAGSMLRYQYRQEKSMIHRWRTHVDGWTQKVPPSLAQRVVVVRFQDLAHDYENLMQSFAGVLGQAPRSLERPGLHENSILPNAGKVGTYREFFNDDDLRLFDDIAGPTMRRLGLDDR